VDGGWHLLAFTRDLEDDITPVRVGERRLMLVRRGEDIEAFDAVCPHRGADLGYGGRLDERVVICPFHGHRIALGGGAGFCVRAYRTLELGGSVFVLLSEDQERGFASFVERFAETHYFVPGFRLTAPVPPRYVIENVCDVDHFTTVHGVHRRPRMRTAVSDGGELRVEAIFSTDGKNRWQDGSARADGGLDTRFCAHVFSPTLVASELGHEDRAQVVITGATATEDGGCVIRVALIVAADGDGPPEQPLVRQLMRDSLRAFEQDLEIWRHLSVDVDPHYAPGDGPVIDYHRFCRAFER
jgi:3-ketosteroid 9alpha-monooxygenase subunit A